MMKKFFEGDLVKFVDPAKFDGNNQPMHVERVDNEYLKLVPYTCHVHQKEVNLVKRNPYVPQEEIISTPQFPCQPGDYIYWLGGNGTVRNEQITDDNYTAMQDRWRLGLIFRTRLDALNYLEERRITTRLKQYAALDPVDIHADSWYEIVYDRGNFLMLEVDTLTCVSIRFSSKELAQQAFNDVGEQRMLWYFGHNLND